MAPPTGSISQLCVCAGVCVWALDTVMWSRLVENKQDQIR